MLRWVAQLEALARLGIGDTGQQVTAVSQEGVGHRRLNPVAGPEPSLTAGSVQARPALERIEREHVRPERFDLPAPPARCAMEAQ